MKRIGNFSIHPSLTEPYFYFERDIGSQECRKVSIVDPSVNEVISSQELEGLEPLAFWETYHIEGRLDGKTRSFNLRHKR